MVHESLFIYCEEILNTNYVVWDILALNSGY
jgi:hypothetical protein